MNAIGQTQRTETHTASPVRDVLPMAVLADALRAGLGGALVTIVGIEGGSPKPLGTHLAVLGDGRHAGHVSGGCIESAIATEIVPLLGGRDQVLRFGKGSCYMDIRFPCGGGADLLVHTAPSPELLDDALARSGRREAFAIVFDPAQSSARLADAGGPSGWVGEVFHRRYLPRTRLVVAGRGPDFEVMARVAAAAELELCLVTPDDGSAAMLVDLDVPIHLLASASQAPALPLDPWTATVTLFHEREWEHQVLAQAAAGPGFYVGALGSQRTHRERRERLLAQGTTPDQVERIRGPIGLVARTKEPGSLAFSVLAEIAAARAALDSA